MTSRDLTENVEQWQISHRCSMCTLMALRMPARIVARAAEYRRW